MRLILAQILTLQDMVEETAFLRRDHDIASELNKLYSNVHHYKELGPDISKQFALMNESALCLHEETKDNSPADHYTKLLMGLTRIELIFNELLHARRLTSRPFTIGQSEYSS